MTSALTGARHFEIVVPAGVSVDRTVLAANGALEIENAVRLASDGGALVTNAGSTGTSIGSDTACTTVESIPSVALGNRTTVTGDVITSGTLARGNSDTISGVLTEHATLTPLYSVSWTSTPPSGSGGDITVPNNGSKALSPGAYGTIHVGARARLTVQAGSYFAEQLVVDPQGVVAVDHGGQAVLVYVATTLSLRGTFQDAGDAGQLLVGFSGTTTVVANGLRGTLVAPNATVNLITPGTPYVGSVFGKSIDVQSNAALTLVPFAHWDLFLTPILSVTCVVEWNSTHFGALFGYTNPFHAPLSIPVGPDNQFTPSVQNFAPITTFEPGDHPGTTTVPLSGDAVTWQVRSATATATRDTLPRCTGSESHLAPAFTPPPNIVDPEHAGPARADIAARALPPVP